MNPSQDTDATPPPAAQASGSDELVLPKAPVEAEPRPRMPDPRQPDPSRPYRCEDCGCYFAPQDVVDYRGDIVCRRCLEQGPPGMSPARKRAVLMVSLALMPIVIFALFLVYQYALKDSVQRALKPRAYAEQAANGDANAAGAGHAEVMPTFTTEQLDAVVVQLLRADSVQSVEVPAAPNTISEFIRNVAPHREAWRRFAKLPAEHVRFIHADLGSWDPKPRYVDVVLSTVTDRWGELRDTLGPPQSKRPSSRVDNSSVWVDLVTDANQTRLEELTGTTWVRYGYLEIVLSTDTPRAYVRGVRIHTDAFLRSHEDAAIADTPAR